MPLALPVETELLQYMSLSRVLTRRILEFSVQDGVLDVIDSMGHFTSREFLVTLERKLGYRLSEAPRQRMATVLLDFLREVGIVEQGQGDAYRCLGAGSSIEELDVYSEAPLLTEERRVVETIHRDQLEFFTLCIESAPGFLRGGGFTCSFSKEYSSVWDGFLGNHLFRSLRKILLRLMGVEDRPDYRMLDLCYGPGHGIRDILGWYPQIELVATDFSSAYDKRVTSKTDSHARTALIDHNWRGFGYPLPYDSDSFNAVHFTFADPYIPSSLREGFYREVLRVIKAGGVLGTLGWEYPDREGTIIADRWVRLQILAHDFAESTCEGWQGFN
ncbi:MAG: hypothetical protein GY721_01540, partial [Deltaproteobacteria bacterium]|nr:hypothetical protein [Deltaproteobacteria bacterium]